ncbi:MAG: MFS transporter [Propionibacteriaceae bacterium]|jgi:MFS family permease|nr:MFS transporter [Propionibacteriaceae bacterium]
MAMSTATASLLRDRHFMTLLVARTLAMLGFAFAPVALAFGILDLPDGTALMLSTVLGFQLAPHVILVLFGGVIADRHPRAYLIAIGEGGVGVCWAAIGYLLLIGFTPLWLLCLFAAGTGIFGSVVYPALTGIIPDLVPVEHLTEGNSWLQLGNATAKLVGIVSGGAVVVWLGGGWALVWAAGVYIVSALLTLTLPKLSTTASKAESMWRQLRDGWDEFASQQWLWVVVLAWGTMYFFFEAMVGVMGPFVSKIDLGGAAGWTMILAGQAVGAMIGVAVSLAWRPKRPLLVGIAFSAVFCGLPGILLGFTLPLWMVVISTVGLGFSFELFTVYWMTAMQLKVSPQALSRVGAYDAFGSILLGPLGLVAAGPAIEAFGVHPSLVFCGVVCTAILGAGILSPGIRHLELNWANADGEVDSSRKAVGIDDPRG